MITMATRLSFAEMWVQAVEETLILEHEFE